MSHLINISNIILYTTVFSVFDSGNIIKNGDFSNSNSLFWSLIGNAKGEIHNGSYKISIISTGQNEWEPQLLQNGLTITKGEVYTLSFDAWAQDTGYIIYSR